MSMIPLGKSSAGQSSLSHASSIGLGFQPPPPKKKSPSKVMPKSVGIPPTPTNFSLCQSRFLGRGCDEAIFSEKKGFSVTRGEAIQ